MLLRVYPFSVPKVQSKQLKQVFQSTSQMHRIGVHHLLWCLPSRCCWEEKIGKMGPKRVTRTKIPGIRLHQKGRGSCNSILLATAYAHNATTDHGIPKAFHTSRHLFWRAFWKTGYGLLSIGFLPEPHYQMTIILAHFNPHIFPLQSPVTFF